MADKPIEVLRLSSLAATIWKNTTKEGKVFFSAAFARNYKDEVGNWKSADSYSGTDLLLLSKLADQAHTRIEELHRAAIAEAKEAQGGAEDGVPL